MINSYKMHIEIARPIDLVWKGITQKRYVSKYYLAPLLTDISKRGDEVAYGLREDKMIQGKVVELDHHKLLKHSFRFSDEKNQAPRSLVSYRLEEHSGKTTVYLEHSGYAPNSAKYGDISMGWPIILNGLKRVLEAS